MKLIKNTILFSMGLVLFFTSCETDFLDRQPLDELSTEKFWITEADAKLALAGVYNNADAWGGHANFIAMFDACTDNCIRTQIHFYPFNRGTLTPSDNVIRDYWNNSYIHIAACNYFLENIDRIEELDATVKAEMVAEVRFLRAFAYYNMSQYWGGVPLVKTILSMDEANSVTSATKENVVSFVLSELTAIEPDLPVIRPLDEHGRIVRGAALAIKGRLLMSEENWSGSASAFKEVMDLEVHVINPGYNQLFDGSSEQSPEIIFSRKYLENEESNPLQLYIRPNVDGGWHWLNPFQNLVDAYLCVDGKTIDNSELYDSINPTENRDPRLLYSIYYPAVSVINGSTYHGHPDSTSTGDEFGEDPGMTGYCVKKYVDEPYTGDVYYGGTDVPIVRYAEVLLSYLECKIKSNDPITQDLLDQTINLVRTRESVNMPVVTETDPTGLWEILKRERRIELAFEGLRYWDLVRWGEAYDVMNRSFYGMHITWDPENYDRYEVGPRGHYYVADLVFRASDLPWPFPQDELDINSNLVQKDNW